MFLKLTSKLSLSMNVEDLDLEALGMAQKVSGTGVPTAGSTCSPICGILRQG